MTIKKPLLALLVLVLLLFGCRNDTNVITPLKDDTKAQLDTENNHIAFDTIASEKTLPAHFNDIAYKREHTPKFQFLVKKSVDESEFEQAWNLYEFQTHMPSVHFNEKDVMFIGVQESGSCPFKIKNIELSSDNNTMTISLSEPGEVCTADATPRTFVIQIDKEISKDVNNVVIIQSGVETNVPI